MPWWRVETCLLWSKWLGPYFMIFTGRNIPKMKIHQWKSKIHPWRLLELWSTFWIQLKLNCLISMSNYCTLQISTISNHYMKYASWNFAGEKKWFHKFFADFFFFVKSDFTNFFALFLQIFRWNQFIWCCLSCCSFKWWRIIDRNRTIFINSSKGNYYW